MSCVTFSRSSFWVNAEETFHKNFLTGNSLLWPVHSSSIAFSGIFTTNFQAVSRTSVHSIASNFTADITFEQTKKHFYPQAETSRHISNHSSIFYHGYGIFIFRISLLVPALKAFSYLWCPYFLVHMKTTNIRFIRSLFFCPFVTHALLLFVLYKHMHCPSTESEAP